MILFPANPEVNVVAAASVRLFPLPLALDDPTPIEHWLELEVGLSAIRADASVEMPLDLLMKKPWNIGRSLEFMIGAGPELVHATGREHGTFWGVSSVVDFMFWMKTNLGWYVEPGYEVTFRGGASRHGLGITAGLLIGR